MNQLTVAPFLVALVIALAAQGTDIYDIHRREVGMLEIEPWRQPRAAVAEVASRVRTWFRNLFVRHRMRIAQVALATLALALSAHDANASAGGVMLTGIVATGEPTLTDVNKALDEMNKLFTQFREENNRRVKAIEDGRAVDPITSEKLKTLSAEMDKFSSVNEQFIAMQARMKRIELAGSGSEGEQRAKHLKLFNRSVRAHAKALGRTVPEGVTPEQLQTYCDGFETYLRLGKEALTDDQKRAMSVGSDPGGGYLVTPDVSGRVVQRIFETSPMRQHANVQTISTDALEGLYDIDEASAAAVGETGSRAETNTPNGPVPYRIPVHEAYAKPKITQKLIEDSEFDVVNWLVRKIADKIGRQQNAWFVTGTGVSQARGFASYTTAATADATRAWGVPEHVATGSSASFGTDPNGINKILTLMGKLKDAYVPNAAFYCNRTTKFSIRQLTDASSAGKYVFLPSFIAGMEDQLLGHPIRTLQDMADIGASTLSLAYGDMFETYQVVQRLALTVLFDPYSSKPYLELYSRARVGGDVVHFEAMKFLKFI